MTKFCSITKTLGVFVYLCVDLSVWMCLCGCVCVYTHILNI